MERSSLYNVASLQDFFEGGLDYDIPVSFVHAQDGDVQINCTAQQFLDGESYFQLHCCGLFEYTITTYRSRLNMYEYNVRIA